MFFLAVSKIMIIFATENYNALILMSQNYQNNQNGRSSQNTPNDQRDQNGLNSQCNRSTPSNQNTQNIPRNQNTPSTQNTPTSPSSPSSPNQHLFLPQHGHYRNLRVYKAAEALYDITFIFCRRFLSSKVDRTVDQMIQAARSGKQNIAEGNQAATTSSETEIKLTNVAKASLEELLVDYEDYLRTRQLTQWDTQHPRYSKMRNWTKTEDFSINHAFRAEQLSDEEVANLGITLCHQIIFMLNNLLKTLQDRFVTQGGIKERMHAARTGYRQEQDEELNNLRQEVPRLKAEIARLRALLEENGIRY